MNDVRYLAGWNVPPPDERDRSRCERQSPDGTYVDSWQRDADGHHQRPPITRELGSQDGAPDVILDEVGRIHDVRGCLDMVPA